MALDSMHRAYANDPIRELIEAREKAHKDELNRHREGRLEGLSEGNLRAARALVAAGVDAEVIQRTLGLSPQHLGE